MTPSTTPALQPDAPALHFRTKTKDVGFIIDPVRPLHDVIKPRKSITGETYHHHVDIGGVRLHPKTYLLRLSEPYRIKFLLQPSRVACHRTNFQLFPGDKDNERHGMWKIAHHYIQKVEKLPSPASFRTGADECRWSADNRQTYLPKCVRGHNFFIQTLDSIDIFFPAKMFSLRILNDFHTITDHLLIREIC